MAFVLENSGNFAKLVHIPKKHSKNIKLNCLHSNLHITTMDFKSKKNIENLVKSWSGHARKI